MIAPADSREPIHGCPTALYYTCTCMYICIVYIVANATQKYLHSPKCISRL